MRFVVAVVLAFVVAVVAFYVGVGGVSYEKREMDELGEVHEVVVAGPYVLIKHGPHRYQTEDDFDKMMKYVEARRASWERWRRLVDKYGDEEYLAYVVPCRILTFDEFRTLAKALNLTDKITGVASYTYYKNGTYHGLGYTLRLEGMSFEDLLLREKAAFEAVGYYVSWLQWRGAGDGEPPPFNRTMAVEVGRSVAEVYVGGFEVKMSLRELYILSKRPEILMVDTPLDLIWKYREAGKIVTVKRVTHYVKLLVEKKNLCNRP